MDQLATVTVRGVPLEVQPGRAVTAAQLEPVGLAAPVGEVVAKREFESFENKLSEGRGDQIALVKRRAGEV